MIMIKIYSIILSFISSHNSLQVTLYVLFLQIFSHEFFINIQLNNQFAIHPKIS
jgi:hypothetical protein